MQQQTTEIPYAEAVALAVRLSEEGRLPDPYSKKYREEIAKLRDEYIRQKAES